MNWPLPDRPDLRDRLLAAYAAPTRGYHDVLHLTEVLDRLDDLGASTDVEVVLAAWFHDAVYDGHPGAEERSAVLAEKELADAPVDAAEVARLVRVTADHRPAPGDTRGALLCDADLAILASTPERYAAYTAGVRREYQHVSDQDFAAGRAQVLRDLLAVPSLFRTPLGRERWEAAARSNVGTELARLLREGA